MFSGSSPRAARSIPSAIARPVARQTSEVDADQCGVRMTLSRSEQRVVEGQRLDLEDVEARAGDPALAQGGRQRRLVDQLAPADVDEVRRRLQRASCSAPIKPRVASVNRQCRLTKSDRRRTSSSEVSSTPSSRATDGFGVRRIGDDAHVERRDQPHQLAAAVAQADDARASGPGSRRPSPTAGGPIGPGGRPVPARAAAWPGPA